MDVKNVKINQLLEGKIQFVVPLFQRSYVWTTKREIKQLWDDINSVFESNIEERRIHFLGSIVTLPTITSIGSVAKYLLIDGQQRLTTLIVLLVALRDSIKNTQNLDSIHFADEIEETYLVNKYKNDNFDYYKILPTQQDRLSLFNLINSKQHHKIDHIQNAYAYFINKFKGFDLNELNEFKNVCLEGLSLVNITLDEKDNPYVVFESLNNKGQSLTQVDLIKNHVFMQIPNEDEQNHLHSDVWEYLQEIFIDSKIFNEFIRHYLMMMSGKFINERDIYLTIRQTINTKEKAISYLNNLKHFSVFYNKFKNPKTELNPRIKQYFMDLILLQTTVAYPFLLGCYNDYHHQKLSEKDFLLILEKIESFLVRRYICGIQTRSLNKLFAILYQKITDKLEINNYSELFLKEFNLELLKNHYPSNDMFCEKFISFPIYDDGKHYARFILNKLETEVYHSKEAIDIYSSALSVEHIMPQTLNEKWLIDHAEHRKWLHTIGNLTLTAYNGELSNKSFLEKKEIYQESRLGLNKYFDNQEEWDIQQILIRANLLLKNILEIFKDLADNETYFIESKTTHKKSYELTIEQNNYKISTWKQMLIEIVQYLYAKNSNENYWLKTFPNLFFKKAEDCRHPYEIKEFLWLETNFSSEHILKHCELLISKTLFI